MSSPLRLIAGAPHCTTTAEYFIGPLAGITAIAGAAPNGPGPAGRGAIPAFLGQPLFP
jgi:hypothetical protein